MGSSASKQATSSKISRNLSKNIVNEDLVKLNRSKINPLDNIHNTASKDQKPYLTRNSGSDIKIHAPTNHLLFSKTSKDSIDNSKYSTKDGFDPHFGEFQRNEIGDDSQFGKKAMSLGSVKLYETKLQLDKNNLAIKTLNTRQKFNEIGEKMKTQLQEKTLLDPRTISAILNELEFSKNPNLKETLVKNFGVHEDLINDLEKGIFKVARTRDSNAKTINDLEYQQSSRTRKHSNKLQEELDKLLQ